jgi:hypothetical protein
LRACRRYWLKLAMNARWPRISRIGAFAPLAGVSGYILSASVGAASRRGMKDLTRFTLSVR